MAEKSLDIVIQAHDRASGEIERVLATIQGATVRLASATVLARVGIAALGASLLQMRAAEAVATGDLAQATAAILRAREAERWMVQTIPFIGRSIARAMAAWSDDEGLRKTLGNVQRLNAEVDRLGVLVASRMARAQIAIARAYGGPAGAAAATRETEETQRRAQAGAAWATVRAAERARIEADAKLEAARTAFGEPRKVQQAVAMAKLVATEALVAEVAAQREVAELERTHDLERKAAATEARQYEIEAAEEIEKKKTEAFKKGAAERAAFLKQAQDIEVRTREAAAGTPRQKLQAALGRQAHEQESALSAVPADTAEARRLRAAIRAAGRVTVDSLWDEMYKGLEEATVEAARKAEHKVRQRRAVAEQTSEFQQTILRAAGQDRAAEELAIKSRYASLRETFAGDKSLVDAAERAELAGVAARRKTEPLEGLDAIVVRPGAERFIRPPEDMATEQLTVTKEMRDLLARIAEAEGLTVTKIDSFRSN